MRERKGRIELEGLLEVWPGAGQVEPVERLGAGEILLVGIDARGPDAGDVHSGRRREVQDAPRQPAEDRHQRVLNREILLGRANERPFADVEHFRGQRRARALLDEAPHHQHPRAGPSRHRRRALERKRRCAGFGHLPHEIGDARVVHDADVLPPREIEVEEVDAGVAQPIDVRRACHVVERHDDPGPVVERRIRSPRGDGHARRPAGRGRAVGALRAKRGSGNRAKQD